MKIIIMLFCLGLDRYLSVGSMLHRFAWFDRYLNYLYQLCAKNNVLGLAKGILAISVVILPIPLLAAIANTLFSSKANGLISFLIGFATLLYTLGPADLYNEVQSYANAAVRGGNLLPEQPAHNIIGGDLTAPVNAGFSQAIFSQANEKMFGVLFWFGILGPFGALLYRMTALLYQAAQHIESPYHVFIDKIAGLYGVINWPCSRFFSLLYGLAGNFTKSFACWRQHAWSGTEKNQQLLIECGQIALDTEAANAEGLAEHDAVLALVDRTLIVFLVIVVIFTLGAWIY